MASLARRLNPSFAPGGREPLCCSRRLRQAGYYGRNVYQHPHPDRMIRARNALVHERVSVSWAMSVLKGG